MHKAFKVYPLIISIIATTQILCLIYARRQVEIHGININCSGIIFPLDLYLFEIIGECYGYEYARQGVWIDSMVHGIFIFAVLILSFIPYPTFMHGDLTYSYKHLIDISWIVAIGSLCGTFLGDLFSARLIPQTKLLLKGRFIFLRFFISHIGSEIIVTSSYLVSFLTNGYKLIPVLKLIGYTVVAKSIVGLLMLPLARYLVTLIKNFEGLEGFDYKQDYQVLSFLINEQKIDFRTTTSIKG